MLVINKDLSLNRKHDFNRTVYYYKTSGLHIPKSPGQIPQGVRHLRPTVQEVPLVLPGLHQPGEDLDPLDRAVHLTPGAAGEALLGEESP